LLGSLEGDELREFEAILRAGGPEVSQVMRESTDLVAQAGFAARLVDPPALLRTKLMKAITPMSEVSKPARRRFNTWAAAGWAMAAGLAVLGYFGLQREAAYRREIAGAIRDLETLRAETAEMRKVMNVVMSRDTRLIRLVTSTPDVPQFRAFWSSPGGLILTGLNIPAPQPGRTMQLWVVPRSGNPVSAGVFKPGADGRVLLFANAVSPPEEAKGLAISDEPDGGSSQPTTVPAWFGAAGG
jgi:anti-sigma-K factor RskA